MKRLLLAALLISSFSLPAEQVGSPASAAARRQEAAREDAERLSRMEADRDALKADRLSLRNEVAKLKQEIAIAREQQGKTGAAIANINPKESLKRLADRITEVDRKREADKQALANEIKHSISKLESVLSAAVARPAPRHEAASAPSAPTTTKTSARTPATPAKATARTSAKASNKSARTAKASDKGSKPPANVSDKGYSYTVKSGDKLSEIINAYNDTFKSKGMGSVTVAQVKAANPGVKLGNLKAGMKIVIPAPAG